MKLRSIGSLAGLALLSCSGGSGGSGGIPYTRPRWANQQRVPTASDLRAVRFNTPTQGFVAGLDSSIFRTDDGGLTWVQEEHVPFHRGGDIHGFDFLGRTLYAVGTDEAGTAGRIWTSGDAVNWSTPDADGSGAVFVSVDVTPGPDGGTPFIGWALREDWKVRVSNGTATNELDTVNPLPAGKATAIDMIFDGRGLLVGEGGVMLTTIDYGSSWLARTGAGSNNLLDAQITPGNYLFACGENATVVWSESIGDFVAIPGNIIPGTQRLRGIHFQPVLPDKNFGWVVGDGGVIYKIEGTFNGASWSWQWTAQASNALGEDLYDVHFADPLTGYAVGNRGMVVKTVNGGTTWTRITSGSLETINALSFDPTGTIGVAAGDAGKVYVTLNGGSLWSETTLGSMRLTGASIPPGNSNVAYVCGEGGHVWRNLDLQAPVANWFQSTDLDLAGRNFRAILFPSSAEVGFVVGDAATLLYTNDGTGAFGWSAPAAVPGGTDYKAICQGLTAGGVTLFAAGTNGVIASNSLASYALAWTDPGGFNRPASDILAIQSPGVDFQLVSTDHASNRLYRGLAGFWEPGSQPDPLPPPAAGLAFPSAVLGWWASDRIYYTEMAANPSLPDWKHSYAHTRSALKAIWMNSTGTVGYAAGENGTILKTVNGGKP